MEEKMKTVIEEREKWLGGSDMRKVFASKDDLNELAYSKAFGSDHSFAGNKYTDYGNQMEPLIRKELNKIFETTFYEECFFDNFLKIRGNVDGYCDKLNLLIEIKTAVPSKSFETCVEQYKYQLLTYSYLLEGTNIVLAVLTNDDFKPVIDSKSTLVYQEFNYDELLELCNLTDEQFEDGILGFWELVSKLKEDGPQVLFLPDVDKKIEEFYILSKRIENYQSELEDIKSEIKTLLELNNIGKYKNPMVTISSKAENERSSFNTDEFKKVYPELYKEFLKTTSVKGSMSFKINKEYEEE